MILILAILSPIKFRINFFCSFGESRRSLYIAAEQNFFSHLQKTRVGNLYSRTRQLHL
ncbi:hypothetical protein DCAR_0831030 [Daucus carota subsp. sativus]|uniref:Uncharacterized protein n=1 Tax=Daucus carota subsp. sativus TaxID=79200 RepID=A0AAF1BC06_DAUCS|nr:hypothetical protein DCAR_0830813 [Daucus carota subsp. sativus]WOH11542.1 hypothetical protein DCAR_0831030 [Daucus carota subsp. sativus]